MVSLETASRSVEPNSSPRISFSADFLDEKEFISISPNSHNRKKEVQREHKAAEFEFLSSNFTSGVNMSSADELIFEGKLLPFMQMQHAEKLKNISLKTEEKQGNSKEENSRPAVNWYIDDDPSPRPPTCTVLWKELLRLKKQKPSSLSPSSSTSSSSSSSSSSSNSDKDESKDIQGIKEKHVNKIKKRLERSKSATIRVRPLINVPICTQQGKNSALPPLFPLKKGRVER